MTEQMSCPECGVKMNFHAEKLVYFEPDLTPRTPMGGRIEEMHTCPRCGRIESRVTSSG